MPHGPGLINVSLILYHLSGGEIRKRHWAEPCCFTYQMHLGEFGDSSSVIGTSQGNHNGYVKSLILHSGDSDCFFVSWKTHLVHTVFSNWSSSTNSHDLSTCSWLITALKSYKCSDFLKQVRWIWSHRQHWWYSLGTSNRCLYRLKHWPIPPCFITRHPQKCNPEITRRWTPASETRTATRRCPGGVCQNALWPRRVSAPVWAADANTSYAGDDSDDLKEIQIFYKGFCAEVKSKEVHVLTAVLRYKSAVLEFTQV